MRKIDRGGGGPSWPGYQIVDIISALEAFREVSGEHPVARAARRHRHIGEHLNGARQAREVREAQAFLAGAALAEMAASERVVESEAELARVVAAFDTLRAEIREANADLSTPNPWSDPAPAVPAARGGGAGVLMVGIAVGIAVGLMARGRG